MKRTHVLTAVLIGAGLVGVVYAFSKKKVAAPGAGGPSSSAGGAVPSRAARSASAGSSGSIPSIIAGVSDILGTARYGAPIETTSVNTGGLTTAPIGNLPQLQSNPVLDLTNPIGFEGSQLVSNESAGTVQLPGLGDFGPDLASSVSALDVGGTDFGTVYA